MNEWAVILTSWAVTIFFIINCLNLESEEKELHKKIEKKLKQDMQNGKSR